MFVFGSACRILQQRAVWLQITTNRTPLLSPSPAADANNTKDALWSQCVFCPIRNFIFHFPETSVLGVKIGLVMLRTSRDFRYWSMCWRMFSPHCRLPPRQPVGKPNYNNLVSTNRGQSLGIFIKQYVARFGPKPINNTNKRGILIFINLDHMFIHLDVEMIHTSQRFLNWSSK